MGRESFATWRIPRAVWGIAFFEDLTRGSGRVGADQRHQHSELEVHVVVRGRASFVVGTERVDAPRGTLIWVPPGVDHTVIEAAPRFARYMVLFRPAVVRRLLDPGTARRLLSPGPPALARTLEASRLARLSATLSELREGPRGSVQLHNAAIGWALGRCWRAYDDTDAAPAVATLHAGVAEVVRLLRGEGVAWSRAELARAARMSEGHLSKRFRADVGVSLVSFRNRCRIDRFVDLFEGGEHPKMISAALDAGFGSYPQFHRVFRASVGCSPAEWATRRAALE